jgi:hypothetical protein
MADSRSSSKPELEYRAKLTELAMSDATTYDLMVASPA